jgi:hypothetical protein
MAMTLISSPGTLAAAHNDMMFIVDSTNKAQPNYKYILDVYIGATKVATMKNRPNPTYSSYGVFNVNKVVQAYLTSRYFIPAGAVPATITGNKVSYQIKVSESYSTTTNVDVIVDGTKVAFNAAASFIDFVNGVTYTDKFLTNRSRTGVIELDTTDNFYVMVLASAATSVDIAAFTAGSITNTSIPISGDVIINLNPTLQGATSADTMVVSLRGSTTLDTLTFKIGACTPYTSVPLHFLNRMGGYETVHFRLVSKKNLKIDIKSLQEQGWVINTSGVNYKDTNGVLYDTQRAYAATYREQLKLTCQALSDEDNEWLEELVTSTSVFTEVGGTYVPVMVKEDSYEAKKRLSDGITNVQITVEFGQINNSQYR